jgi:hypothetical protein
VLSIAVAAVILFVVVDYVSSHNSDSTVQTPNAQANVNREGDIVVKQDQAPRVVALAAGAAPASAIARAVRADISKQVDQGFVNGPIERTTCTALKPHGSTVPFKCTVRAAHIGYPFLGVVDATAKRITYCKQDPAPIPSQTIPVSRRCTA